MIDNRDVRSFPYLVSILLIVAITFLGACGKDNKAGATDGVGSGSSTVPDSVDDYSSYTGGDDLYGGSTAGSLPSTNTVSDLQDPAVQSILNDILGTGGSSDFLSSLLGMDNPSSLAGIGTDMGRALALLQAFTQQSDSKARDEFTLLLKLIAAELQELKKNFSKDKLKAFGKRNRGRIAGIVKRACGRKKSGK